MGVARRVNEIIGTERGGGGRTRKEMGENGRVRNKMIGVERTGNEG